MACLISEHSKHIWWKYKLMYFYSCQLTKMLNSFRVLLVSSRSLAPVEKNFMLTYACISASSRVRGISSNQERLRQERSPHGGAARAPHYRGRFSWAGKINPKWNRRGSEHSTAPCSCWWTYKMRNKVRQKQKTTGNVDKDSCSEQILTQLNEERGVKQSYSMLWCILTFSALVKLQVTHVLERKYARNPGRAIEWMLKF